MKRTFNDVGPTQCVHHCDGHILLLQNTIHTNLKGKTQMNKKQRQTLKRYAEAKYDAEFSTPGGIEKKLFSHLASCPDAKRYMGDNVRTFQGIYEYIERERYGRIHMPGYQSYEKDYLLLDSLGFQDGLSKQFPTVNCNGKRHRISVLPDGEMILHAHEIESDDEKVSKTLQTLGRLGGSGQLSSSSKAEHRCGTVKRLYQKALRSRSKLDVLSESELKQLPKRFRQIVNARNVRYYSKNKPHNWQHWGGSQISRREIRQCTLDDTLKRTIACCVRAWEQACSTVSAEHQFLPQMGDASNRQWLIFMYRTKLHLTVDNTGFSLGRDTEPQHIRSKILSIDESTFSGRKDTEAYDAAVSTFDLDTLDHHRSSRTPDVILKMVYLYQVTL